jgi:Mg-chelatase subunit ChlD
MGKTLIGFFEQVGKEFGVSGRVKLAMLTKISSEKAESAVDSTENIRAFEEALKQLRQQLNK